MCVHDYRIDDFVVEISQCEQKKTMKFFCTINGPAAALRRANNIWLTLELAKQEKSDRMVHKNRDRFNSVVCFCSLFSASINFNLKYK